MTEETREIRIFTKEVEGCSAALCPGGVHNVHGYVYCYSANQFFKDDPDGKFIGRFPDWCPLRVKTQDYDVVAEYHNVESVREKLVATGQKDAANWSPEAIVQYALMNTAMTLLVKGKQQREWEQMKENRQEKSK